MSSSRPVLLYIHGYTSSPLSQKATATRDYIDRNQLDVEFVCPQLPEKPQRAMAILEQTIAGLDCSPVLIGSSMGGFYATCLTELHGYRSAMINPAVAPQRLVAERLGPNTNPYTGEVFVLVQEDVDYFEALNPRINHCRDCSIVLLETGDETLDYRDALSYYEGVPTVVEQGGDHRCQSYERYLPLIFDSLGLPTPSATTLGVSGGVPES